MLDLTIITINLDNVDGLRRTYNSIQYFVDKGIQWVIIDGASTDGSVGFLNNLRSHSPNFVIISEPDNGIYDAMNKGIAHASRSSILILNSGDVLLQDNIKNYANIISKRGFHFLMSEFVYNNRVIKVKPPCYRYWSLPTSHQAIVYDRAIFDDGLHFDDQLMYASDFKHFIQAYEKYKVVRNLSFPTVKNDEYGSNAHLTIVESEYISILADRLGFIGTLIGRLRFLILKIRL